jgi:putative DNA primase/helicase
LTNEQRGATAQEWFVFDFVLGLGSNLLPCVPAAPDVRVAQGSALEGKVGKIPSQFNGAGEAHGLLNWQKREIFGNEVKMWSADRRLNICVRTGPISGVYAFDVDIDTVDSDSVFNFFERSGLFGTMFFRGRTNSRKFLLPFLMDEPCKKRKIYLNPDRKGPAIELLADGQQFVAAGSHSSGARYQWLPDSPTHLPVLTLEQVNHLWQQLTSRYATESSPTAPASKSDSPSSGSPGPSSSNDSVTSALTTISDQDWSQLLAALRFLLDKVADNDTWSQVGYALLSLQGSRDAEGLWYDFSQKAVGYEAGAPEAWWQAHKRAPTRTDYRHIFTLARQRGWGATSRPEDFPPVPPKASRPETENQHEGVSETGEGSGRSDGPNGTDPGASALLAPLPERAIVRLVEKDYSQIIDQLELVAKPEMYTQGMNLVRLSPGHEDAKIERSDDQLMLVPITKAYARKRLGEQAMFVRFNAKKEEWTEVAPSAEHINALLEQGSWRKLRPLDAIARAPFVRRDGSICDTPGYDSASRALLIPSAEFPAIPGDPGHADAVSALERVRGIFHQFPWASPAAESGFLAHVLSEAGRLAVNKCPMFFYNAPTAGTGKTLLQKAASIISHGSVPALRPWLGDGDEIRKTIYASLLAGDRSLLFDNVPDGVKIRSAELCAAITAENWQDRKLGESESRSVPNRAVFSASGNNISPSGDLARRSVVIRLDANTEKLAQRRFDIEDLESYLVRERPRLLVDALTIIRAYHRTAATDMTMPVPLPSFEQWSHFVREPLIWLGLPDPVETQKSDASEDSDNLASAFSLLSARFGTGRFTGVDVAHAAGGISDANGQLTNILIASGCKEPNSPHRVGYWLRSNRDKVFGGMKLVSAGHVAVGASWQFVKVE